LTIENFNRLKTQAVFEKRGRIMNDEHLAEKELREYGENSVSPREFLRRQTHLETCPECQRRLDEMLPNLGIAETEMLFNALKENPADEFHLNYDEHLQPYVYQTIDAVTHEIVESHVEICAECREDLRDLLSFHESLETDRQLREATRKSWWTDLAKWLNRPSPRQVWLAMAGILLFVGIAGFSWIYYFNQPKEIVQTQVNQENTNLPKTTTAQVNQNLAVNTNQNKELTNQNKALPTPAATIKPSPANAENQSASELPEEPKMANLVLPKFLKDLRINEAGVLLGNNDSPTQQISVISPNTQVIRDSSPVLSWKSAPNVENYEVAVFDEDDNRLAKAENFKGNLWRVPKLAKGKIYQWQVTGKAVSADGQITNFLGKGRFYVVSQRDESRIAQAKNALERGKAFAEAGLLKEATNEFRQYLKQNPNSENAKKFLRQVEQAQK
jgi:hypothetical protein